MTQRKKRSELLTIRMRPWEMDLVRAGASARGIPVAAFVRRLTLPEAAAASVEEPGLERDEVHT